jgi:DNA-directed RNA polymerase I, II, and III subunit RPABC1
MSGSVPFPLAPTISPFKTLEKVLNTVHEMFTDRGYTLSPRAEWSKKNQQMEDLKAIANTDADRVFVYFATEVKVPVKKMREYVAHMEENKINHAVIVYAHQLTPGAKTELSQKYDIETFQAKELFENPTRHSLVPRHEQLHTEQEVQDVMSKYHVKSKKDFPIYYTNDKVVRYYHWSPGTVVKIYRTLGGQREPEIYYRCVRT